MNTLLNHSQNTLNKRNTSYFSVKSLSTGSNKKRNVLKEGEDEDDTVTEQLH